MAPIIVFPDMSDFLYDPATTLEAVLANPDLRSLVKKQHEQLIA